MDTRQLIEASAEIITITRLQAGDVYKRIEEGGYGSPLRFGIVQSVMNNGAESAFTALEFTPNYGSVNAEIKVFSAGKPIAIFAAMPAEVQEHCNQVLQASSAAVAVKQRELVAAQLTLRTAQASISAALRGTLTTPQVTGEVLAEITDKQSL